MTLLLFGWGGGEVGLGFEEVRLPTDPGKICLLTTTSDGTCNSVVTRKKLKKDDQ